MEEDRFAKIMLISENAKKEGAAFGKKRYLYEEVKNVPEGYFAGICGLRGIGKTVLLLQLANEVKNSLYFSADAVYLKDLELYEIAEFAGKRGFRNIFIDEIHYKKDWQQDLKTLYDEGSVRVFFSGSSAIEIRKGADLSRRALLFSMKPLSFREYLMMKKDKENLESLDYSVLFNSEKRGKMIKQTSDCSSYFGEYCKFGGLLYPSMDSNYYYKALETTIDKIIHSDLEALRAVNANIENDIYKILEWIAISPVGEVNYSNLSSRISVTKPTLIRIVRDLERIGILKTILPCGKSGIRKEPKIYLAFPFREFFCSQMTAKPDIGSLREEFFVQHAGDVCYLKGKRGEKTSDFLFHGKRIEIGGMGKKHSQNPDFILKDGITFEEDAIPLYLAGFLY